MISCGRQSRKSRRAKPRAEGWWKSCVSFGVLDRLWADGADDAATGKLGGIVGIVRIMRPVGEITHSPVKSMFCTSSSETFWGYLGTAVPYLRQEPPSRKPHHPPP